MDLFAKKELRLKNRDPHKEELAKTRAALALCENLDTNVGRVLRKLKQLDLDHDIIVVYLCDNGPK